MHYYMGVVIVVIRESIGVSMKVIICPNIIVWSSKIW